ncbi:MAG: 2-succinyl-5-enolpyruvyl-6-hydroxy-3-cyclohexene-1-carboxylic-acid synthase [Simkaniaceae bacterium]|nr:2-succinyl-5-enolpyruvyl-6-hydroxy-3-cyclohexene-1-carboxylic-acid synthase [Candidatus Sacchlamyda saccharinae]
MESFGKTIIAQLIEQGVTYFCMAPGFRSTPLALAAAENPDAETVVHFDERGLAFHALGVAKAKKKPVAIIVTSGTAVGNLMPAVMEAEASHTPLILLTSDRPHELRDTMANQTCDQIKIFGDFVRYFFDLPTPSSKLPQNFLATTIAQARSRASFPIPGPVQINCPFREPFVSGEPTEASICNKIQYSTPKLGLENPTQWADDLKRIEKGVIILGSGSPDATKLSQNLGWPILPDIISGYRETAGNRSIAHYHHILKAHPELEVDCLLHLGDAVVSKTLIQWMAKAPRQIHVAKHPKRLDPSHTVTDRVICDPDLFCQEVAGALEPAGSSWFSMWKNLSNFTKSALVLPKGSEPSVMEWIKEKETALFIGNSMPIRDADMFLFPEKPCGPIFANRGLSGIDGNIATIAGIAQQYPVTAVIGDQTALHDLNSLALLKKVKHRVQLVIINNGGGGIFSFVAIGKRKDLLDPYFAAAHDKTFENAAKMFDLSYANSLDDDADIIELFTNREENLKVHQQIEDRLCSSFFTVS